MDLRQQKRKGGLRMPWGCLVQQFPFIKNCTRLMRSLSHPTRGSGLRKQRKQRKQGKQGKQRIEKLNN